jgi:hypothetical protein
MCSCRTQRPAFSGYSCSTGKAPHLSQDSVIVSAWNQSLITKNSMCTDSNCSLLPGLPIFSSRLHNRRSHTGASSLISLIEPACPFCSIPPKEMENVKASREPNSSVMLAAQRWNVRPAWDASLAKRIAKSDRIHSGKQLLIRIVAMLTRLVERFDPDEFRVRQDEPNA